MQRPIKFRAWSKIAKKMGTVTAMICGIEGSVLIETSDGYSGSNDIKDVELMQYTGLKDKHGKEIYEGDIVATDYDGGWKGEVKFQFAEYILKWHSFAQELPKLYSNNWELEVIGDIYSNPELLEATK